MRQVGWIKQIQYLNMGSSESMAESHPLKFNSNNWVVAEGESEEQAASYGNYVRLRNKMTGQHINEYELVFSDQDGYQQFMEMLAFRNAHDLLVNVDYLKEEKIDHLCSLVVNMKAYIRHFPLRLCDVEEVPFPENIYILARVLAGFNLLYNQVGPFAITEDLICINEQGIVKTWLNSNLAKSYSQGSGRQGYFQKCSKPKSSQGVQDSSSQNAMVWQLITILEQITDKQSLPQGVSFIDHLRSINKSHLGFSLAAQLALSYAHHYQGQIPQVFQSALKAMRERNGIFDSQIGATKPQPNMGDIDLANLGSRFKESKVERVKSEKNALAASYVASESNHTFADKLKNYDTSKGKANGFGKASRSKDTPVKQGMAATEKKEPLTERIVSNQLSFSSISSPQAHSLTAIGQLSKTEPQAPSNSNSDIISNLKQTNPLALSDSPAKDRPTTYFSQYMDPLQSQTKIAKKPTIFSFGEAQEENNFCFNESRANDKFLKNAPITQSLENSKNSKGESLRQHRPIVTFTYNASQPQLFPSSSQPVAQQIATPRLMQQDSKDFMEMPFSPPSVDKSSLSLELAKKSQQNDRVLADKPRTIGEKFTTPWMDGEGIGPFSEKKGLNQQQLKRGQKEKIKGEFAEEVKMEKLPKSSSDHTLTPIKEKQPQEQDLLVVNSRDIITPQKWQQEIANILQNEFDLDPEIVSDLLDYEQHRLSKKKNKKGNKL